MYSITILHINNAPQYPPTYKFIRKNCLAGKQTSLTTLPNLQRFTLIFKNMTCLFKVSSKQRVICISCLYQRLKSWFPSKRSNANNMATCPERFHRHNQYQFLYLLLLLYRQISGKILPQLINC